MTSTQLVSVILSFRNEEEVIPELVKRLAAALRSAGTDYELIFVNDDSSDGSLEVLTALRDAGETGIKILNMSRRFGVSECVLAGMEHASGDAVVYMDSDLQDPPELIPEMIAKWRDGADVVYTVRSKREGETPFKLFATRLAYRMIRGISSIDLPENAGDFRLLSRRAANELLRLKDEKAPYLRGLVRWIGFRQDPVMYERQARPAGTTHFPLFKSRGPAAMFIAGVTSFSLFPLHFFFYLGLALSVLATLLLGAGLVLALSSIALPANWFLGSGILLLSGVQLLGIGVIGLYLGRIHEQVRHRPAYVVRDKVGF